MGTDLRSRLRLPPRRFRRLILAGLLLPTLFFSWGVRTQGCSSDTPVALLPVSHTSVYADAQVWWVVPVTLLFLALPFGVERVASRGWRALLNVAGVVAGAFCLLTLLFAALFAQAMFGRVLSLSVAGNLGLVLTLALLLEALSWPVTDVRDAFRARREGERTSGVQPVSERDAAPELPDNDPTEP